MKNEKRYSFLKRESQALAFTPLKGMISSQDRSQHNLSKFLSWNGKLSLRDNRLIVFVNFSFSNGCDLHDRRQKKKLSDCISVWHATLL